MEWWEYHDFRERGVPFAIDRSGAWRDVDEVPRGKACHCTCPDCGGPVLARQGNIRVHHFAHDDRRECRHALEASLYGMALSLLTEPNAVLALPPAGTGSDLVREMNATLDEVNSLLPMGAVIPEAAITLTGAVSTGSHLRDCSPERPDLYVPGQKLAVHLLSYRKSLAQVQAPPLDSELAVLGINLRAYVQIWWEVCDDNKEATIRAAANARELMRRWLAGQYSGRGWLHHPELDRKKATLRERVMRERAERRREEDRRNIEGRTEEIRRQNQIAEQKRIAEEMWTIPAVNARSPTEPGWIATASGLQRRPTEVMKAATVEAQRWLTTSLAVNYGLYWHSDRRHWVYVGRVGDIVPPLARDVLDPKRPWEPMSIEDQQAICGARVSVDPQVPPRLVPPSPAPYATYPAKQDAESPDEVLRTNAGSCWCGAALDEVRLGSGVFSGKRVLRCTSNPKHPIKMLGV